MRDVYKPVVKDFLTSIIPDIENIDGGCKDCISSFVDGVNETLKDKGLKLHCSEDGPVTVWLEEKDI